jgi:predicted ATPase
LGPSLISTRGFGATEVAQNYTRARVLCEQLGETPQIFPVLWGLARMHDVRGELKVGRELGEQLFTIAQRGQDPALLLEAHHTLWSTLTNLGELTTARTHMEQGFALYDPQKHKHHAFLYGGHDPGVCCGGHAAEVLGLLGYPDQALRRSQDALSLARELSHPSSIAHALSFAAWFHQLRGEREAVQARVAEAMALATEQGFSPRRAQADFLQGWLLVEQGHREAGIAQMIDAKTAGHAAASGRWDAHIAALLSDTYGKEGQTAEGLRVVNEELSRLQITGARFYEAELYRINGELLLRQAVPDEELAETCFDKAIEVARWQQAKSLELRAAMSLSRLWQRQEKKAEAQNLLAEVYGWFTEGFDTADLKQAKLLLEELA